MVGTILPCNIAIQEIMIIIHIIEALEHLSLTS